MTDKKFIQILGHRMAYREAGSGDPIVFLHGNPTSSFLWRNIIPQLQHLGRCIAPDLIGMGDSEKLEGKGDEQYYFETHRAHLAAFLDALNVRKHVVLVLHDWGSALGFDWAASHRDALDGIAFMEALVQPFTWDEWPEHRRAAFQALRSEAGEDLVLQQNFFVEKILPTGVIRALSDEEMNEYRRPFLQAGEDRRITLTWPRQLPIDGQPAEISTIVERYGRWLSQSTVPKLFINADPGSILTGSKRDFVRSWPNQVEVTVRGRHFLQEDSPESIGSAIATWYQMIRRESAAA